MMVPDELYVAKVISRNILSASIITDMLIADKSPSLDVNVEISGIARHPVRCQLFLDSGPKDLMFKVNNYS